MKKLFIITPLVGLCILAFPGGSGIRASQVAATLTASLSGFEEPPAIATSASGNFSAMVSPDETTIDYQLSYSGFGTDVMVAHIHLGLPSVNGGVTVFLCGGAGTPDCPPRSGTATGTITADDVGGIPGQRLAAGDLPKLLEAIRANATYVNVHSMDLPGGEIRGQIKITE